MPHVCKQIGPNCGVEKTIYGYFPNLGATIFFTIFFGIAIIVHICLGFRHKSWALMVWVVMGCIGECIGNAGRILVHYNPWEDDGFKMQVCLLIISPAFLAAGVYLTLSHVCNLIGPQYSIVRPGLYTIIFVAGDWLSLLVQAIGGGISAAANDDETYKLKVGGYHMLAGVTVQVAVSLVFIVFVSTYFIRVWSNRRFLSLSARNTLSSGGFQFFLAAQATACLAIMTRCVYRLAEMTDGWYGPELRKEVAFIVLDSSLIALATLAMTFGYPPIYLPTMAWEAGEHASLSMLWRSKDANATSADDIPMSFAYQKTGFKTMDSLASSRTDLVPDRPNRF